MRGDHSGWEADVLLADGGVVHLRPPRASDEPALRAMYGRLSRETLEYRFFGASEGSVDRDVARVLAVDGVDRVALLATLGPAVVGLSYFSRSGTRDEAEVAFLVEDSQQGRGLGSVVLEHLAAVGREVGLRRFTAEVLPDNRIMIAVFRDAGFQVSADYGDGAIQLSVDLAPTLRSREVQRAREHHAEARSVARMLSPRTVAVIGASRQPGTAGHEVFRSILGSSFAGVTFPVNPAARQVAGVLAYPNILAVPGEVDVVFVATPADQVAEVVPDCAAKGVHTLVVLSGGFAERGDEGRARQGELVSVARSHGMRVVGPACMGIMNTDPAVSLNGTLVAELPRRGHVGFFAQSGALSADVLSRALDRGIGVSVLVSAGNRSDVSGNDLLQYWLDDDTTDVVLLYLETFGNPHKFARLARALSRLKPVIAVQTSAPRDRARSDAMFAQAGLIRVDTLGEMLDVATLVSRTSLPTGNRVAIINNMMSLGSIAAAACAVHDLEVAGGAPTDLGAAASVEDLADALAASLADPEVDAVVTAFVPPLHDPAVAGRVIERLAAGSSKPVLVTSPGYPDADIPTYASPEEAVRALAHAVRYAEWRALPAGHVPVLDDVDVHRAADLVRTAEAAGVTVLAAEAATDLLEAYGLSLGPGLEPDDQTVTVALTDDAVFGRALSLGVTGIATELFGDRTWRALPMTDVDPARMISELRAAPLLHGYGGRPPVDVAALEDLLLRLGRLGTDLPQVVDLTLTVVCKASGGVDVAAWRASVAAQDLSDAPRRLDAPEGET